MARKRNFVFALAVLIQILVVLTLYINPMLFINRNTLDIDGTLKERLSIVIVSNRVDNIRTLKERTNFSPLEPSSLVGRTDLNLTGSPIEIIKNLYLSALEQCDRVYCMLLEDDIVFIYKELRDVLFDNLLSYNNDNDYIFDCSKKGFLRKNYAPNGNGAYCRIFSKYAIQALKKCLPTCALSVDVCFEPCLADYEEKRFLLAQHAGFKSSRS
ncbi:hypothetical protein BGW38_000940 [Lunasporangiospora selenospora]|uniref:Uncharacterized protein n=1 Tax=Lunasporangiospora selenospora TaxID=979761 RepID=A0A9P6FUZ5_9FUNG|nr:hypothetical protein BGW38_000940 [Lunasporangiospora selenospora]